MEKVEGLSVLARHPWPSSGGQGVAEMHGRNRGPEVVTGQLLTSTNSELPVHFQALEKGYPEDDTRTVIADTDTSLTGVQGALKGGQNGRSSKRKS